MKELEGMKVVDEDFASDGTYWSLQTAQGFNAAIDAAINLITGGSND